MVNPKTLIILGTGLSNILSSTYEEEPRITPYSELFRFNTEMLHNAIGFIHTKIKGKDVLFMDGRFHLYEGFTAKEVVTPVQYAIRSGIEKVIITCAAGSLFKSKDLVGRTMVVIDQINLMATSPLEGLHDVSLSSERFPDLVSMYEDINHDLKGILVGVRGPQLETRAEYRMLSQYADAVTMSTIQEAIAAKAMGAKVYGLAALTDYCWHAEVGHTTIEEIKENAAKSSLEMKNLIMNLL